jgi:hypothetical protein
MLWLSFAPDIVTSCGAARTQANRLFRFVGSVKPLSSERKGTAMLEALVQADRHVPLDQTSILAAKARPISNKKSLFDAVPLLVPLRGSDREFQRCRLNRGDKSAANKP